MSKNKMDKRDILLLFFINFLFIIAQCVTKDILSSILSAMAYLILLIYGINVKREKALQAAFFFSPSQAIVKISPVPFCLLGIYIIIVFFRNGFKIKRRVPFVSMMGLLIIGLINSIKISSLYDIAITIQFILICLLFISYNADIKEVFGAEYIDYFLLGAMALVVNFFIYSLCYKVNVFDRLGKSFDNANYLAVIYAVSALICLARCLTEGRKSAILPGIVFLTMLLISGSRGGLLAFILGASWYYVSTLRRINGWHIMLAVLACFFVYILLFSNISFIKNIRENIITRTINGIINASNGKYTDISSGRFYLWNMYWKEYVKKLDAIMIGVGLDKYEVRVTGQEMSVHSIVLSSLITEGIIGTFCILRIYYSLLFSKSISNPKSAFSFPIVAFVGYFFLDGIFDIRMIFYMLLAGYFGLNVKKKAVMDKY